MAESKVQKVARGQTKNKLKIEKCECGGEFAWVLFSPGAKRGGMVHMCDKCAKVK